MNDREKNDEIEQELEEPQELWQPGEPSQARLVRKKAKERERDIQTIVLGALMGIWPGS